jgi:pyruvate formate lyase activating enzyme
MTGYIFDIKKFALHDGPGIRTTIFLTGCPLNCWWCHNPESIKVNAQSGNNSCEDNQNKISIKYSLEEVLSVIKKDLIFYDESGGGVTFSGGEPLIQIDFLESILELCKKNSISTTIDTCGYVHLESFKRIYKNTDLFLYDFKLLNDDLHKKYTGVSNKLIIENLEFLDDVNANIIIRIPLIPDITDTVDNLSSIANYLNSRKNINRIDLLPYNKLAEDKYRRLQQTPQLGNLETQTEAKLIEILRLVESFGFEAKLNG